jgi:hypothetical protein
MMSLHGTCFITTNGLNETNHRFITFGVERGIITSLGTFEFVRTISQWILRDVWNNVISEVSCESHTVFSLYSESLIVNSTPSSFNRCFIVWSLNCGLEITKHLNVVNVFLFESKLMLLIQYLYMVWSLMGAHFVCLEQIDLLDVLGYMELPLSESVVFQTMDWLICFHSKIRWA